MSFRTCVSFILWCFINKVREEHDQIINRFGTGATRLANHPNEHNAYIYTTDTACLPPSSDSFPASLLHPNSSPLIYFIPHQGRGSSLGSGHVPGPEPSPRTASQNMLTIAIWLNVRVNSWTCGRKKKKKNVSVGVFVRLLKVNGVHCCSQKNGSHAGLENIWRGLNKDRSFHFWVNSFWKLQFESQFEFQFHLHLKR